MKTSKQLVDSPPLPHRDRPALGIPIRLERVTGTVSIIFGGVLCGERIVVKVRDRPNRNRICTIEAKSAFGVVPDLLRFSCRNGAAVNQWELGLFVAQLMMVWLSSCRVSSLLLFSLRGMINKETSKYLRHGHWICGFRWNVIEQNKQHWLGGNWLESASNFE